MFSVRYVLIYIFLQSSNDFCWLIKPSEFLIARVYAHAESWISVENSIISFFSCLTFVIDLGFQKMAGVGSICMCVINHEVQLFLLLLVHWCSNESVDGLNMNRTLFHEVQSFVQVRDTVCRFDCRPKNSHPPYSETTTILVFYCK